MDNSTVLRKSFPCPAADNDYLLDHVQLLRDSLLLLSGRDLVEPKISPLEAARRIFHAPFVVLSHSNDPDPVLTYANLAGLKLFEMDWDRLVVTPSRFTAESPDRRERMHLLKRVTATGFIDDYAGTRVTASGRRFRIENATVWNLAGKANEFYGQAATFDSWNYL